MPGVGRQSKGKAGLRKHGRQYRSPAHQKYVSYGKWLEHKLDNAKRHPESLSIPDYDAMGRTVPYAVKRVSLAEYTEYVKDKANTMRSLSANRSKGKE